MTTTSEPLVVYLGDHVLSWEHVLVACPDCGRADGLLLVAKSSADWAGQQAEAQCPACATNFAHPLVYPKLVRALAAWHTAGATDEGFLDALRKLKWSPHELEASGESLVDGTSVIYSYRPWSEATVMLDRLVYDNRLRQQWPALVTAWERTVGVADQR